MIEIRKAVSAFLKALHPRVYFQVAPENATFPYIVYDLPSTFDDGEGGETITIDIDGWDKNDTGDTTAIETLMETINSLDKEVLATDNILVVFYLENKLPIIDDDKRIKHRRYTYSGHLF